MSRALLFLLGQAVPLLLGVPVAMSRRWSSLLGWAWLAAAYFVGSLVLAVAGIVLSAVGVPWTAVSVAIAGGVIAAATAIVLRSPVAPQDPRRAGPPVPALLGIVAVAGFAMLATAASLGNSVDFTFFWGPKAVLFASSRGIDFRALADPFSNYGHITYPTLWPTMSPITPLHCCSRRSG